MATDAERNRAFRAERRRQLKAYAGLHRAALDEVKRLLKKAQANIAAELKAAPSDFQSWHLANLNQSIDATLAEIGTEMSEAGSARIEAAHQAGVSLIDEPIRAGGINIAAVLQSPDTRQLAAMRTFFTDKLKDVSREAAAKIKSQLGLSIVGTQTTGDAVTQVQGILRSSRSRAITITRTEIGRAYSTAAQERMSQAKEVVPGLKKQWRRSGKIHSRLQHDLTDGQIRDVDKPFNVGGIELMIPRDPNGPAKETINCGCLSLPYMEHWRVAQPDRQPFSDQEVFLNPRKRDIARELNPPISRAAPGLSSIRALEREHATSARRIIADQLQTESFRRFLKGSLKTRDHFPVGLLGEDLKAALGSEASVLRLSTFTHIKQQAHRRGQAFTPADYRRVQALLDEGTALQESDRLMLVFGVIEGKLWKAVVKRTESGRELYLQSLHRATAKQRRREIARHRLVREGK